VGVGRRRSRWPRFWWAGRAVPLSARAWRAYFSEADWNIRKGWPRPAVLPSSGTSRAKPFLYKRIVRSWPTRCTLLDSQRLLHVCRRTVAPHLQGFPKHLALRRPRPLPAVCRRLIIAAACAARSRDWYLCRRRLRAQWLLRILHLGLSARLLLGQWLMGHWGLGELRLPELLTVVVRRLRGRSLLPRLRQRLLQRLRQRLIYGLLQRLL